MKTFRVLKWDKRPDKHQISNEYDLVCPHCETEAICPVRNTAFIVARAGAMGFVFEGNRKDQLPDEIQCRQCGKIYGLNP
jgi:DNA-directed RNA polymerase subunit RPC12/RpoP